MAQRTDAYADTSALIAFLNRSDTYHPLFWRLFADQDLTLADALGLHLMQSMAIPQCWSTDFHLGLTGVPLVIHDANGGDREIGILVEDGLILLATLVRPVRHRS